MTYKIEGIVEKIESPILCNFTGITRKYENGKVLAEQTFEKRYIISSIRAENGTVILEMEDRETIPKVNWKTEETVDFS